MAKTKKKNKKEPRRAIALGQTAIEMVSTIESVPLGEAFSVSVNGLQVTGTPTFEEWDALARMLRVTERSIQFAIGDMLNAMEDRLGEDAAQIVDAEDWSEKTVAVYRWIAKKIAPERRRMDRLTIKHHMLVAALSPSRQTHWLRKAAADAEEKPWTAARLKAEMTEQGEIVEWWVHVRVGSHEEQDQLLEAMEAQGKPAKAHVKRVKAGQVQPEPEAES